jgi:hypothetical protein
MSDGIKWQANAWVEKYSQAQTDAAVRELAGMGIECPGGHENAAHHPEYRSHFREALRRTGDPEHGVTEIPGNLLVTVGLNQITNVIIGGGDNAFSHANAIVGVGAGTTAAAVGDTALTDDNTANAYYQQADSGNPTQANGVITCVCTFTGSNADFAWQEWCWAFGGGGTITAGTHLSAVTSTAPTMVNHKVQSLGTKTAGSWVFTTTVTLS